MKIIQNILQKTGASKLWFVLAVVFIAILNISAVEAKSLKTGEEFKEKNGRTIRVVSSDEMEIENSSGEIFIGKYSVDGERVRVVTTPLGMSMVQYFKITSDGLKEEKGGEIYYSKAAFATYTAEKERRKIAEEVKERKAKSSWDLYRAVNDGNADRVKSLLSQGADPNVKDNDGNAALVFAVQNNNTEIVKMLLAKGADANAKDSAGGVALTGAAQRDNTEIVKMLLAKGVDVNAKNSNGDVALSFAVGKNNTEIVKMLLAKGADANTKNSNGGVALGIAAENGNAEIVKMLLAKGADANAKNSNGVVALGIAAENGNTEIVKMLLAKGADVNAKNSTGNAALVFAVQKNNTEIVKILLDKGADANAKNSKGRPVLINSAWKEQAEIVKMLLAKGADANAKDSAGNVALDFAVDKNNTEIVKMLLDKGADANEKGPGGITALIIATKKGNTEIVKLLQEKGAVQKAGDSFIVNGGEVTDNKTGLIWRRCAEGMEFSGDNCQGKARTFTYKQAMEYAAAQANSTSIAWRVPKKFELNSIVVKSNKPAIDPTTFPASPASIFWTSDILGVMPNNAFVVSFGNDNVGTSSIGNSYYVRLVRAAVPATATTVSVPAAVQAAKFTFNGGEVTDNKTGLIWRRCAEGMVYSGNTCTGAASIFTYEQTLQHATAQANSTGIAWRVPDKDEIASIVDKSYSNPTIDPIAFPAMPASMYWSSSPYVGYPDFSWGISFGHGNAGYYNRLSNLFVLLVRTGQ